MNLKKFFSCERASDKTRQSKVFKAIFIILGAIIIFLFGFNAGKLIGYKKARFSYKWGENYHRNFAGPKSGFFGEASRGFKNDDYTNAHGVFGFIVKIEDRLIVVNGSDNIEKAIIVSDKTKIINLRNVIKTSDLKIDDQVVVIGSPNDQGQIEAKLIRIFH